MNDQPTSRVWVAQHAGAQRAAGAYQAVMAQPSWVVRATLLVFMLVIGVPIVLLVLLALLAAVVVFTILVGVRRFLSLFSPQRGGVGRENVRVIRRVD